MQIFVTTTQELEQKRVDTSDVLNLKVKIGNTVYTLAERDGSLRVSIEGQLVAMPVAANMLSLSSAKQ